MFSLGNDAKQHRRHSMEDCTPRKSSQSLSSSHSDEPNKHQRKASLENLPRPTMNEKQASLRSFAESIKGVIKMATTTTSSNRVGEYRKSLSMTNLQYQEYSDDDDDDYDSDSSQSHSKLLVFENDHADHWLSKDLINPIPLNEASSRTMSTVPMMEDWTEDYSDEGSLHVEELSIRQVSPHSSFTPTSSSKVTHISHQSLPDMCFSTASPSPKIKEEDQAYSGMSSETGNHDTFKVTLSPRRSPKPKKTAVSGSTTTDALISPRHKEKDRKLPHHTRRASTGECSVVKRRGPSQGTLWMQSSNQGSKKHLEFDPGREDAAFMTRPMLDQSPPSTPRKSTKSKTSKSPKTPSSSASKKSRKGSVSKKHRRRSSTNSIDVLPSAPSLVSPSPQAERKKKKKSSKSRRHDRKHHNANRHQHDHVATWIRKNEDLILSANVVDNLIGESASKMLLKKKKKKTHKKHRNSIGNSSSAHSSSVAME